MKLYGYWRSSATYRVRIAFGLKDAAYDYQPVDLLGGQQSADDYLKRNPQALVPSLVTDDGDAITQSLAIIEYLDETLPGASIVGDGAVRRAHARSIAAAIACEAQPFVNLRIQRYMVDEAGVSDAGKKAWLDKWVGGAVRAVGAIVDRTGGAFCVGDVPTIADACLIPQLFACKRFGIDLKGCERLFEIEARCAELPAFANAHPDKQPDAK